MFKIHIENIKSFRLQSTYLKMSQILNIEIKARMEDPTAMRNYLKQQQADFKGEDHQIDTYFNTSQGRLKLRQGNIECSLIGYNRPNQDGPKRSDVELQALNSEVAKGIKSALTTTLGIKKVVDKRREIYFIDNVKFHIDTVEGLGHFMEIEAIDAHGDLGEAHLSQQCNHYMQELGIQQEQLVEVSYSDMV